MIGYKENKKRFFLFAAMVIMVWLIVFSALSRLFPFQGGGLTKESATISGFSVSETGEFYLEKDFDAGYRFNRIEVYAENISISNDKIGFFSSYINRKILLKGLNIRLQAACGNLDNPSEPAAIDTSLTPTTNSLAANLQLNFDTSNILSLLVAGLDYRVVDEDNNELLSIVSNRASLQQKKLQILLEGNVAVSTDCGRLLQSNKILWDLSNKTFTANGAYLLTENGQRKSGKNVEIQYQGCSLDMNIFNDLFGKGSVK